MNKISILAFFLLIVGLGFSSSMSINSTVVNASNLSQPLEYANVTIYNMTFLPNSPPEYVQLNSTLTDENGTFLLTFDYDESNMMKFEVFLNDSNGVIAGSTPINVPAMELYMTFVSLDTLGLNIGLVEAGTLFLNATNRSAEPSNFSYTIMNGNSELVTSGNNIENATINLVANQNYTLIYFHFVEGGEGALPQSMIIYASNLTNDKTTIGAIDVFPVELNLTQDIINITGYINATGNSSAVNISRVVFYPMTANTVHMGSNTGVVDFISVDGSGAYYVNTSTNNYSTGVPGSAAGVEYLMLVLGKDETGEAGNYDNFGVFKTMTAENSNMEINLTLRPLIGDYLYQAGAFSGGEVNSSKLYVTLVNSSGDLQNAGGMMRLNVSDYNETDSFNYLLDVEANTSGYFIFPIANNTNFTYEVFAGGFAPKKGQFTSLIAANTSLNITLSQMEMKTPDGEDMLPQVYFYPQNDLTTGASCDIPDPSFNCTYLASMDVEGAQGSFSPFAFTLSGVNPNLLIYVNGVYLYLINVDLLASGPPNAEFDESSTDATSGSSMEQARRIGSFAPKVYDHAYVGFGLDSRADITQPVSALFTELYGEYDDSWDPVWNNTAGSGDENASDIPAYYQDYYDTDLLLNRTAGGLPCNSTNTSKTCYLDTTDKVMWVKIPHFSGGKLEASLTYTPSSSSTSTSSKSKGTIILTYELTCKDGTVSVYAKEASEELSGVKIILLGISSYYSDTQTTDSNGLATYTITKDGTYKLIATKDNYYTQTLADVDLTLCLDAITTLPTEPEQEETPVVVEQEEEEIIPVETPSQDKLDADAAIITAQEEIVLAEIEGKITAEAKQILEDAKTAYASGDYKSAKELAVYSATLIVEPAAEPEAEPEVKKTEQPKQDNTLMYLLGAVIVVVILAGAYYFLKGKGSSGFKGYKK
ncbi:MAG: hypothetical protein WC501_00400 [Candidatus Micrarchaeia archaeon]